MNAPDILKLSSMLDGYSSLDVGHSPSTYLGISRFFTIFEKNWLKHFTTSDSLWNNLSFSTKVIFFLASIFQKVKFYQFANFFGTPKILSIKIGKIFHHFFSQERYARRLSFRFLFLNLVFCKTAWYKVLFINGLLFHRKYFFFWGACWFRISVHTLITW